MWGKSRLDIPECGFCGPLTTFGLSDELAMTMGRSVAWTLSDEHQHVIVALSDGTVKAISIDTVKHDIVIGTLEFNSIGRSHDDWISL